MSFLSVEDVHIKLGEFSLNGISLKVQKGDYLTLIGPTGAGKTILLECITGFYIPEKGRIVLEGKDITRERPCTRNIGIVYQDYALLPHMTVFQNIAYGLKKKVTHREVIDTQVREMAHAMRIDHLLQRLPATLSGGEQQRTALARALIVEPRLLLLDEPLSALDPQTRKKTRILIKDAIRKAGTTVIHITHDMDDVWFLADKVAVFRKGEILQTGSFEDVFNKPRSRFTANFVGVRILDGNVEGRDGDRTRINAGGLILRSADPAEKGSKVRVAIRPENIMLARKRPEEISAGNVIETVIEDISTESGLQSLTLKAGQTRLCVLVTRNALEHLSLKPGNTVYALIKCTHVRIV